MSFVLSIAILCLITPKYVVADYDVARSTPPVIQSIASELIFDEHDRLAKLAVVFDASNPACHTMVKHFLQRDLRNTPTDASRIQLAAVEGHAFDRVFGPYVTETSGCLAACIERGTERDLAGYVMPHEVYDSNSWESSSRRDISGWFAQTCSKKEICLMNYHSKDHPLQVYWKSKTGDLVHHMNVTYGDKHTRCFDSYLGHHFVARDESSDPANAKVIGEVTVEFNTVKAWGESPPSDDREPSHNFDAEIEVTLQQEWKRHERIKRTFSPLGFKKGKLPKDVFASLSSFYYNNAQNVVREEWTNRGVFVNWWETDVLFLQIPWHAKTIYQERLRKLVEEWAGVPVEETMMYGLRQYTQGARLLTHVDRHVTHAVSLIINIAQGNLTEDWPVEVHDHADRLHEIVMEPGDIVYYESAKCLHGRNRPMTGPKAYYTNMFAHYRPIQDGQWWTDANPEGSPEPVLGDKPVTEECRLARKSTAVADDKHEGGFLQRVECDNPSLGQFISPDLFQATNAEDLIKWWRMTSPASEDSPSIISGTPSEDSTLGMTEGEL